MPNETIQNGVRDRMEQLNKNLIFSLVLLLAGVLFVLVACGGNDEQAGQSAVLEQRVVTLENKMRNLEEYIAAQAVLQQQGGGTGASDSESSYNLEKEKASENEIGIVRFMAECSANSYLNPALPDQVKQREIEKVEQELWDALSSGQYTSFEQFVGPSFKFCSATILEESE